VLTRLAEQKTPGLERVPGFVLAVAASNTYLTGSSVTTSEADVTADAPGLACNVVVTVTEADALPTLEETSESVGVW